MQGEKQQLIAESRDDAASLDKWNLFNGGSFLLLSALSQLSNKNIPVKRKIWLNSADAEKLIRYNREIVNLTAQIEDASLKLEVQKETDDSKVIAQYRTELVSERYNRECDMFCVKKRMTDLIGYTAGFESTSKQVR